MKISVIVPVYNSEKTLDRCVESILSQTYKDWELILIDDGSVDASVQICDRYQQIDSRIKVIHKENGGVSRARNVGIEQAQGTWLAFLDSDDYFESNALESCVEYSLLGNPEVIYFDARIIYNSSFEVYKSSPRNSDKVKFLQNYIPSVWTTLCFLFVKKELVDSYKLRLEPDMAYCEDFLFSVQAFLNAREWVYCERALYVYDQRNMSSVTHNRPRKHFSDEIKAYEIITQKLKEKGLYDNLKKQLDWRRLNCRMMALYHNPESLDVIDLSDISLSHIWSQPLWGINHKIIMWFDTHRMTPVAKIILGIQTKVKAKIKKISKT